MEFVGIDKFSLLDYDEKISAVLFSPACNFRCPFCHNGDSVLNSKASINFEKIITYLKTKRGLIDAVVISGGEPTLMPELEKRIKEIKELGFLVKIDTNGTNPDVLRTLINENLIDYVAMDIKNSESLYPMTSGCDTDYIKNIKESLEILRNSKIKYELRTTLVKEFHTIESINEMKELIKGHRKLYLQKFVDREGVIKKGLHEISLEEAISFKNILSEVIETELRGY